MEEQVSKVEGVEQRLAQLQSDRVMQLLANIQSGPGTLNMAFVPPSAQNSPFPLLGRIIEGNSNRGFGLSGLENQIALQGLPLPTSTILPPTRTAVLPNPPTINPILPFRLPLSLQLNSGLPREAQLQLLNNAAKQIQAEIVIEKYKEEYTKILQNFARTSGDNQATVSSSEQSQDATEPNTETTESDSEESRISMLTNQQSEKGRVKSCRDSSKRKTFPKILYELLQEQCNNDEIISWLPDGTGFIIHNKDEFEKVLLQKHFRGIKFRSFQRQLNIYGFQRLEECESHSYKHKFFLRDHSGLLNNIKRIPIKKTNASRA